MIIIPGLRYFYNIMAAVVSINSRYDIRIEACHRNQPNKTKQFDINIVCLYTYTVNYIITMKLYVELEFAGSISLVCTCHVNLLIAILSGEFVWWVDRFGSCIWNTLMNSKNIANVRQYQEKFLQLGCPEILYCQTDRTEGQCTER